MKRLIALALGVFAALALPAVASAQVVMHTDMTRKADLQLTQPLVVGTQTVQPGEYRYQCITIGEETFLVITNDAGKEVARVPCKAEPLAKKAELSDIRTTTRDGQVYLTAVRIKGEVVMHRLVPTPGA